MMLYYLGNARGENVVNKVCLLVEWWFPVLFRIFVYAYVRACARIRARARKLSKAVRHFVCSKVLCCFANLDYV